MITARAFLSRAEAAEYVQSHGLPLARGTLQKYATTGEGPRYHKFGQRCVYRREDLDGDQTGSTRDLLQQRRRIR